MNRLRRVLIVITLLIAVVLLISQYKIKIYEIVPLQSRDKMKYILYWTPMFQQLDFNFGLGSNIFQNCAYKNCYTTYNRTHLPIDEFDAILFHGIEYREETWGKPGKRAPNQIYIFSNQESPIYTPNFIADYNDFYNWTMTYRLDSDIIRPYGAIEKKKTDHRPPSIKEIQSRPKLIAWFASNCGTSSDRELLYKKLSQFVQIDVYGICGNLTCPKEQRYKCYKMLEENYKFYLAFENSVCQDYVTEKLYNVLKLNIVPIVYGGADYKKIAPPNSVINVKDFKSVEDLVKYIIDLDRNPEKYLKFFEWKKYYISDTSNKLALCGMCRKLNEQIQPKVYSDISEWWKGTNFEKCRIGDFDTKVF